MGLKWQWATLLAVLLAGISAVCNADMISNELIGNDVALEKLCITRAKVKPVPFFMDERYLNSSRTNDPDVTFIAADGISPQLIQCKRNGGDGKYGPFSSSPETWYWHLKKPPQFSPSISTNQGASIAAKLCVDEVKTKVSEADVSSINRNLLLEISLTGPLYKAGFTVNGIKANRYDVLVGGNILLKSNGPDLKAKPYMCLLSPMLELRAISLK
jgi:hypothetical protein